MNKLTTYSIKFRIQSPLILDYSFIIVNLLNESLNTLLFIYYPRPFPINIFKDVQPKRNGGGGDKTVYLITVFLTFFMDTLLLKKKGDNHS